MRGAGLALWLLPPLLGLIAFSIGLGAEFSLDDVPAILENPVVGGELPASSAWSRTFWGRPLAEPPASYRPLAVLSFRLDHALYGFSSLGFHATSLLIYLAVIHLGQRVARTWTCGPRSAVALGLFAVHPLHAENVTSLVGRADLLALSFGLGALAWAPRRPGLAVLAYLGAIGCKESAIVLPAIVGLLALSEHRPWSVALRPTAILAVVGVVALVARLILIPATFDAERVLDDVLREASVGERLAYVAWVTGESLRLLVLPFSACTGRKYAEVALPSLADPILWLGVLAIAAAIGHGARAIRQGRFPAFLLALVAFLPFSGLLFTSPEAMADRFLLVPGYFFLLGVVTQVPSPRTTAMAWIHRAVLGLVLAVWIPMAIESAAAWHSTETVLRHGVRTCPASIHNRVRWARTLHDRGEIEEAAWHFAVATEARRHFPRPWQNPAAGIEDELDAPERLRQAPELLGVADPEWRTHAAAALTRAGFPEEAAALHAAAGR